MRRFVAVGLLVSAGVFLSSAPAFAQATGTLTGSVLDQDSLVLPGVTVVATNTDTGATRESVTSGTGNYTMPALIPGPYEVRAELAGFDPAVGLANVVTASTVTVDLQMGIAQLEETVVVRGAAPLVEVTQAVVAASIRQEEVRELPMINRSLSAMMNLLPGAREVEASGSHGHASNYVSFAGNTGRSYNMYVDGIDNKEDQDGGTLLQYSLDGIEEFRALGAGLPGGVRARLDGGDAGHPLGHERVHGHRLSAGAQPVDGGDGLLLEPGERRAWASSRSTGFSSAARSAARSAGTMPGSSRRSRKSGSNSSCPVRRQVIDRAPGALRRRGRRRTSW